MALQRISPEKAKALMETGAVLVDIREHGERAVAHIENSVSLPLSELGSKDLPPDTKVVIYHCRSGMRTAQNAASLEEKASCQAYLLDGGIEAWRNAGLPVSTARKRAPLEMFRQVQITAGLLVLAGVVLAIFVTPAWLWLAGFIGGGLVFSGVTGKCPMANMLAVMPWNRAAS